MSRWEGRPKHSTDQKAELPNLAVVDQDGALRAPRADASASASALGGPAERASAPRRQTAADRPGSLVVRPVLGDVVFLGGSLSRSRPPRLGRSLRFVACDRLRRTQTRHPLARDRRLSRKTGKKQAHDATKPRRRPRSAAG